MGIKNESDVEIKYTDSTLILDFIKALDKDDTFTNNMKALAECDNVKLKHVGIIGYGVFMYFFNEQKKARDKINEFTQNSVHVGEIKERLDMNVIVAGVLEQHGSDYMTGETILKDMVTFNDSEGNVYVWWASGITGLESEIGNEIHIRGTVKAHKEFNKVKQTILTRVMVK